MRNAGDLRDSGARVGSLGDGIAGILKSEAQDAPQAVFVFNEKDVRHDKQKSEFRSQNPDKDRWDHFILASEILRPETSCHDSSLVARVSSALTIMPSD